MKEVYRILKYFLITGILGFCIFNSFHPVNIKFYKKAILEKNENKPKADKPDQFAQYFKDISTREGKSSPSYPPNHKISELKKAEEALKYQSFLKSSGVNAVTFSERGPSNVPGRTRGLLVVPTDPLKLTWFAGSVGGGIWKTTDGGSTWVNKTPDLPNLATTTLAMSESDPSIIYAGTGEGFFNLDWIDGDGIFKSIDGGETWNQLDSTAGNVEFENINRIIVDPANPDIILAATQGGPPFTSGIHKSIDGGQTWTKVYDAGTRVQQIIADPNNFMTQYATVRFETPALFAGVVKSIDGGNTWSESSSGLFPGGRVEIAIAPSDSNRLYATVEGALTDSSSAAVFSDLYISEDAGQNWQLVVDQNGQNQDWFRGQGWYNNALAVHPYNEDIVYVGGIGIFKVQMQAGSDETDPALLDAKEIDTETFLAWVNWGGGFLNGGFDTGPGWFSTGGFNNYPQDLLASDFSSVEIRFGPGLSQMAHRFTVPVDGGTNSDGGAGIPPEEHFYQNYVEVPFEVWDIDNNRQLMLSFRDQERNGVYNLNPRDDENDPQLLDAREYIFIHGIEYNPANADPNIAQDAGQGYKTIYAGWPILAEGATWNPDSLPDSKIVTEYGTLTIRFRQSTEIASNDGSLDLRGVHPDHHNIYPIPMGAGTFKILDANDGGVFVTATSTTPGENLDWSMVGRTMNTGQFYGVDKKAGENQYIGGLQDNGSWRSQVNPGAGSAYNLLFGGDGIEVAWNYEDPEQIILTTPNNRIRRSTDGGSNFFDAQGISDQGNNAPFLTKITNNKRAPDVVFAVGSSGVWRSNNFGEEWFLLPIETNWTGLNNSVSTLRVESSLADNSIVWAGGAMTSDRKIHVSTNGGLDFNETNNFTDVTLGSISGFATHPDDKNTAYALFSIAKAPKILRTTNLGQSWEDISGFGTGEVSTNGFPDVKVYSLFVFPNNTSRIWAGTEIGIMESLDNGISWALLQSNFPNVSVWEMKAVDNQIVIATHGRGIWSATVDGLDWPGVIVGVEDEIEENFKFKVYPNPVFDHVTIDFNLSEQSPVNFQLTDLNGKIMVKKDLGIMPVGDYHYKLDLPSIKNGLYLLTLQRGKKANTKKIIINR